MDQDSPSSRRGKRRFVPKAPQSSRKPKPPPPSSEELDQEREAAEARSLLSRVTANLTRQVPKVEKKSTAQVTFGFGAPSSTAIQSFGVHKEGNGAKSTDPGPEDSSSNDEKTMVSLLSSAEEDGTDTHSSDTDDALASKTKKDYKEPWDYEAYYPTALPLRRPFSGDPEILDEVEFGEAARNQEYDESKINTASCLGLQEACNKERMFFVQLPTDLPLAKRSASRKGKEKAESAKQEGGSKCCTMEDLSMGKMGAMLVYKSGAVKLKLGEILYDVSPGSDCTFPQDVAAINTTEKHCCALGKLEKRMVVTPDIDSLLDSGINLGG